jgi:hypothetical protein
MKKAMITPFRAPGPAIETADDRSGHRHRKIVGFLGLLLPLLLWLLYAWRPIDGQARWRFLDSVSAYYHTGAVTAFVGVLIALSVFLFSYQGYSNRSGRRDRIAAVIAGTAAALVALVPTGVPDGVPEPGWYSGWMRVVHYVSAAVLFLSFIFFSLFQFPQSAVRKEAQTTGKRTRNWIYRICGVVMIVCVAWAALAGRQHKPIFWPEVLAILAFAISWLTKGRADALLRAAGRRTSEYMQHPSRLASDAWSAIRSIGTHGVASSDSVAGGPDYAADLRTTVTRAAAALRAIPAERAQTRPAPGKWSAREIIGHLIDSASNNHQRFVRAQFRDDLRFDGYAQDDWVRSQDYQHESWPALVMLWESFNLHIARFMECCPADVRTRPRVDHNLDVIAWEELPREETATLDYFMRDYVNHLKHHLRQIDPRLAGAPERQRR